MSNYDGSESAAYPLSSADFFPSADDLHPATSSGGRGYDYDSYRMPYAYSISPPPSTHTALSSFTRSLILPPAPARSRPRLLRCEFQPWTGCQEAFQLDEVDLWIRHIEDDHLQRNYPTLCICWFCDDFWYDCRKYYSDPGSNFENRMRHIADHMLDGYLFEQRRPDFHFLEHVYKIGLISSEAFRQAQELSEGPPPPPGLEVRPPGWRPPRSRRSEAVVEVAGPSRRRNRDHRRHH